MTITANPRGRHRPQLISVTEAAARLDISTRTLADAWLLALDEFGTLGLGDSVKVAQKNAYAAADQIHFDGAQMRRDIGWRALKR